MEKLAGPDHKAGGAAPWTAEQLWFMCKGCHGMDGKGNTTVGAREKIPEFTSPDWQSRISDNAIRNIITHGSQRNPKMKAYGESGDKFSPAEIESLIPYIRNIREK